MKRILPSVNYNDKMAIYLYKRRFLIVRTSLLLLTSCFLLASCTSEQIDNALDAINTASDECQEELNLLFDFDDADVSKQKDNEKIILCIVDKFKDEESITLEGHADERGTREYNLALGDRRASSAKAALKKAGFKGDIQTLSYGEEKPSCNESHDECHQENRRVTIAKK